MSEKLTVVAQCQRCGRGYIHVAEGVERDVYGTPGYRRARRPLQDYKPGEIPECGGAIRTLERPVPIDQFKNYGPLLPTAA